MVTTILASTSRELTLSTLRQRAAERRGQDVRMREALLRIRIPSNIIEGLRTRVV